MPSPDAPLARLHADLGLRSLSAVWAKVEILLGLTAVAVGWIAAVRLAQRPAAEVPEWAWLGPPALLVLGGYLALAGHRSHLYQSNNRLAAHLAELIRTHRPPEARS